MPIFLTAGAPSSGKTPRKKCGVLQLIILIAVTATGSPSVEAASGEVTASKKTCNCGKFKTEAQALQALRRDPNSFENNMSLARVLTANGKSIAGEKYIRTALIKAKNNRQRTSANALLGWNLSEQGKHAQSVAAYETSLKLREVAAKSHKPNSKELEESAMQMQQLAAQYRKQNRQAQARAMMDQAADTMEAAHGKDHALSKLTREMARAFH